ncbi:MAG: hypothetical protein WCF30_20725 [Terracidiphilus sp.]
MRSHAFCYFHARLHSTSKLGVVDDVTLPIPEDSRAIQESLGKLFQAILTSRIDSKKAAQLLWGLQIASSNLPRKPRPDPKSVPSVTRNKDGVELAPALDVCDPITDCGRCDKAETCDRFFDFDALAGLREPDSDETDEDGDKPVAERPPCVNEQGEIIDVDEYRRQNGIWCYDDKDEKKEDDEDDEMDGKALLKRLRFSRQMEKTLELEE